MIKKKSLDFKEMVEKICLGNKISHAVRGYWFSHININETGLDFSLRAVSNRNFQSPWRQVNRFAVYRNFEKNIKWMLRD